MATNTGHGHVFPRPDGAVARCGGPAICAQCALDATSKAQRLQTVELPKSASRAHRLIHEIASAASEKKIWDIPCIEKHFAEVRREVIEQVIKEIECRADLKHLYDPRTCKQLAHILKEMLK